MSMIQQVVVKNGIIGFKPNTLQQVPFTTSTLSLEDLLFDYGLIIPITPEYINTANGFIGEKSVDFDSRYMFITPDLVMCIKNLTTSKISMVPFSKTCTLVNSSGYGSLIKLSLGIKLLDTPQEIIEVLSKSEEYSENMDDFVFLTIKDLIELFKGRKFKNVSLHHSGNYLVSTD
jgi:hypothetical protein